MKPFRILHLSDIHIGDTYEEPRSIAYRIIADIENEGIKDIRSVLITGDIFEGKCGDTEDIIEKAVDFFNVICQELNSGTEIDKTDFLFVPGNHDILRTDEKSERWSKYIRFLEAFYGKIPDFYDRDYLSLVKVYEEGKIVFAGFNSCGLEKEPEIDGELIEKVKKIPQDKFDAAGIGKDALLSFLNRQSEEKSFVDFGEITHEQILHMKRKLKSYDDYNIVAFFHHHFYLFPEVYTKYNNTSLIRNYTAVIQQMQQLGVRTVLHGHKHFDLERPLITDEYYNNINSVINIISGGSVGTRRVSKHTFNVIEFYDNDSGIELMQKKFIYNSDHLEPIVTRQIPPQAVHNNVHIRLLSTLKLNDMELFSKYTETIEKVNLAVDDYANMNNWLENIFAGFHEVFKVFEKDSLCIFFLLFAMNYRILKIKQILGKENIDDSYFEILNQLIWSEKEKIDFDIQQYIRLFEETDLNLVKEKCDLLLNSVKNKRDKNYLAFSMIAVFITDLYLMLRYYADSFYNRYIKLKVNIRLDESEFHQNVPVRKIMIRSDADRRSAYIDLKCNSAAAHKLAVLFVKEFELIISRYEDYFKIVGLKLYYISPKIEKGDVQNTVDNYNFEAYIPTLIPLLTGDNIYARKEVFARELIQNSIDAIAVREAQGDEFDHTIHITLDKDDNGRTFFRIKDSGTGMDRFKIERYFTSIGRSFYSGDEYRDLELSYKPISNFGIGFLSTFMVCREIDVRTKYYTDEKEGLKLHIPNYDGCFFIEKDDNIDIGTEITVYIDPVISHCIQVKSIIKYIRRVIRDIQYDIVIHDKLNDKETVMEAHRIRKSVGNKKILFVPFLEDGTVKTGIDLQSDIWSGSYIEKYPYGLLADLSKDEREYEGAVLNTGILLSDATVPEVWAKLFGGFRIIRSVNWGNVFIFNFPSNYLRVDVSREKVTEFLNILEDGFSEKILEQLYQQICQLLEAAKEGIIEIEALKLYNLINKLIDNLIRSRHKDETLDDLKKKLTNLNYTMFLRFQEDSINFVVGHCSKPPKGAVALAEEHYEEIRTGISQFLTRTGRKDSPEQSPGYTNVTGENLYDQTDSSENVVLEYGKIYFEGFREAASGRHGLKKSKYLLSHTLHCQNDEMEYTVLFLLSVLFHDKSYWHADAEELQRNLLRKYSVSDIETKECGIEVTGDDIIKVIRG